MIKNHKAIGKLAAGKRTYERNGDLRWMVQTKSVVVRCLPEH